MALDDEAQTVFKANFAFGEQHFNRAGDEARLERLDGRLPTGDWTKLASGSNKNDEGDTLHCFKIFEDPPC